MLWRAPIAVETAVYSDGATVAFVGDGASVAQAAANTGPGGAITAPPASAVGAGAASTSSAGVSTAVASGLPGAVGGGGAADGCRGAQGTGEGMQRLRSSRKK